MGEDSFRPMCASGLLSIEFLFKCLARMFPQQPCSPVIASLGECVSVRLVCICLFERNRVITPNTGGSK